MEGAEERGGWVGEVPHKADAQPLNKSQTAVGEQVFSSFIRLPDKHC